MSVLFSLLSLSLSAQIQLDSINIQNPNCGSGNGNLVLHASGGATGLSFSIDGGASFQADSSFSSLNEGVYNISVQDSAGNSLDTTILLVGLGTVTINNINETNPPCADESLGIIDVSANGGSTGLIYSIDGGLSFSASNVYDSLSGGSYNIIVMDSSFCGDTATVVLNNPAPVVQNLTITDADCPIDNGQIDISASGGNGNYSYSINGGQSFSALSSFPGLASGVYHVWTQDGFGCTDSTYVIVESTSGPNILTLNFIHPLCNGSNNGSITVFAQGSSPISYSIDGINFGNSNTFTGLAPGTYPIAVQDGNGCIVGQVIDIVEPDVLEVSVTAFDETCIGGDGSINFSATGGNGAYEYSIDTGNTFVSMSTFSPVSSGTYEWLVQDQNGCFANGSVTINSGGGPTITGINVVQPSCASSNDGEIIINAISQTSSISYSINGGAVLFPSGIFSGLSAGNYDIYVEDANGCVSTQNVTLTGPGNIIADFSTDVTTGLMPLQVNFTNNSQGATSYSWDFVLGSSIQQNPSFTFDQEGQYYVVLTVSDGNCTDTTGILIEVLGEPGLTAPNVFTPDGDGINDTWYPEVVGISELEGEIYDRWGNLVYKWQGPEGYWDGHTSPGGLPCKEGAYYYLINAKDVDNKIHQLHGYIQLFRQ